MKRRNRMEKVKLYVAGLALCTGLGLAGCKNVETMPEMPEENTMTETGEISEAVSEEAEEATEEAVNEYSAESIIAMMDEAVTEYEYDDPGQIRAMILAINMEHMTEEDIQAVMKNYDYTLEDLGQLYEAAVNEYYFMRICCGYYVDVSSGRPPQEVEPEKRFYAVDYLLDIGLRELIVGDKFNGFTLTPDRIVIYKEKKGRFELFFDDSFYEENEHKQAELTETEKIIYDLQGRIFYSEGEYTCLNPYTHTEFTLFYEEIYDRFEAFLDEHPKQPYPSKA